MRTVATAVLLGFVVAFVSTPAGVSGSFLLLPSQVSLIGVVTPSASATNLIFNLVSTPGAIWRYGRQGQIDAALVVPIALGTVPGVIAGAWLRDGLEGLLARLARTAHADRLVLKGGMLLAAFGQTTPHPRPGHAC